MGFTLDALEPATVDHPGAMHGIRKTRDGPETATVAIVCHKGGGADINASQDNAFLGQVEFKRGFYMSFTGVVSQEEGQATAAQAEAARPFEEKQRKGLQVWLRPVPGVGSKLDFNLDLAAGGVLPVLVTVNNVTTHSYTMDPSDVVLIAERRHPRAAAGARRRGATRRQPPPPSSQRRPPRPPLADVTQELESHLLHRPLRPAQAAPSAWGKRNGLEAVRLELLCHRGKRGWGAAFGLRAAAAATRCAASWSASGGRTGPVVCNQHDVARLGRSGVGRRREVRVDGHQHGQHAAGLEIKIEVELRPQTRDPRLHASALLLLERACTSACTAAACFLGDRPR